MNTNHLSKLDRWIVRFDREILPVFSGLYPTERPYPAANISEKPLDPESRRKVEGFMRVNHAGEVSAQALYQGQALAAREAKVKASMEESAQEERDHLNWCRQRLEELDGRTSYLDPLWYVGSLTLGTAAGLYGDKWSLGFIEETERQVVEHLEAHLEDLPVEDEKTRAVLEQMKVDEAHHGQKAMESGAIELPQGVKNIMKLFSKLMTKTAFWI